MCLLPLTTMDRPYGWSILPPLHNSTTRPSYREKKTSDNYKPQEYMHSYQRYLHKCFFSANLSALSATRLAIFYDFSMDDTCKWIVSAMLLHLHLIMSSCQPNMWNSGISVDATQNQWLIYLEWYFFWITLNILVSKLFLIMLNSLNSVCVLSILVYELTQHRVAYSII